MRRTLLVGVVILVVTGLAIGIAWFTQPQRFRGTAYATPYPPAPPIELKRADGSLFRLADQQGKIVLLFFGYTSCPDVCPTTLAEMKRVVEQLGRDGEKVQVVFISVDPERDTPQRIQEYVRHFHPEFIGLSGSLEELQPIWQAYGIYRAVVSTESMLGYLVDHTARVFLIDTRGYLRLSYGFQTPVGDIVHDIRLLLRSDS